MTCRLGFRRQRGGRIGELEWRPPSPDRILSILRHPIYAGAYAYGLHRAGTKNPATGRAEGGKWFVPPEELPVLLRDRLPAYISWDHYLANQERLKQNRSLLETRGRAEARRGAAARPGRVRQVRPSHGDPLQGGQEAQLLLRRVLRGLALDEHCGHIAAATLDDLVAREVLRALEPAALDLSLRAIENVEQERKRLHDQWRQTLERAGQEVARAERQYQAVEPENRLVARTLEARWEEALKKQRQVEEEYHRFLAKLPATLERRGPGADPSPSPGASPRSGTRPGTSAADRKQIMRCVVERVIVVADKSTELNDVTIVWQGGMTTQHQVARPVGTYDAAERFPTPHRTDRATPPRGAPPRTDRRADSTTRASSHLAVAASSRRATIGSLMRDLGLVGELFRDDLVGKDEWWIPDLARELGVIPQKIHYWVKQGWVHSRRTPSGKHLIVWADKDEVHRLRQLATGRTPGSPPDTPSWSFPRAVPHDSNGARRLIDPEQIARAEFV